jgi:hypothetical protein
MSSYQLIESSFPPSVLPTSVTRELDRASIPLAQDNCDCVQFLADWKAGTKVTNADGSPAPYSDDAVRALGLALETIQTPTVIAVAS